MQYAKSIVEDIILDKIMKKHGITKSKAKKLYANSLLYNTVVNEILDQIDYLVFNKVELV